MWEPLGVCALSFPFLFIAAFYVLNPVTVSLYPPFAMSPATFRITVMVPRHAQNRQLCYAIDGPEMKKSCIQLDGESSQKVWTVYWDLRTAGEYEASAVLTRMTDGRERTYRDSHPFRVLGYEP